MVYTIDLTVPDIEDIQDVEEIWDIEDIGDIENIGDIWDIEDIRNSLEGEGAKMALIDLRNARPFVYHTAGML